MSGDLVLLTGATGFLGFRVLVTALERGYRVRCAIRAPSGKQKVLDTESIRRLSPSEEQLSWVIVPDITVPSAYDEAVKDAKYVIHCASPVPSFDGNPPGKSDEELFVNPAIAGVLRMLESAATTGKPTVKRVVITSSVVGIVPFSWYQGHMPEKLLPVSPDQRLEDMSSPLPPGSAYFASKVASLNAGERWMKENSPKFDTVKFMPAWICGRDELSKSTPQLRKTSNNHIIKLLLGTQTSHAINTGFISVEDVAKAHVLALEPRVKGNSSFALGRLDEIEGAKAIARKHFPEAFEQGIFSDQGHQAVWRIPLDTSSSQKDLGLQQGSFETLVKEIAQQYIELHKEAGA